METAAQLCHPNFINSGKEGWALRTGTQVFWFDFSLLWIQCISVVRSQTVPFLWPFIGIKREDESGCFAVITGKMSKEKEVAWGNRGPGWNQGLKTSWPKVPPNQDFPSLHCLKLLHLLLCSVEEATKAEKYEEINKKDYYQLPIPRANIHFLQKWEEMLQCWEKVLQVSVTLVSARSRSRNSITGWYMGLYVGHCYQISPSRSQGLQWGLKACLTGESVGNCCSREAPRG